MAALMFSRVAILGLGLMGGSLGMALRESHLAATVAGYDANVDTAARAVAVGTVDAAATSPDKAVAGADLVVLAAPILALRELLAEIAPALSPSAVVTDLGSTKRQVVNWAQELLPDPSRFVGGHPMAGREQPGIDAATPDLFSGAVWCLTPSPITAADVTMRVSELARGVNASPLTLDAATHDDLVAGASHLPLLAAAALVRVAAADAGWAQLAALAAGGFRDTTRVASGDARMARDICLTNREAILSWLDRYIAELGVIRRLVADGDGAVENWFENARHQRDEWRRQRPI